MKILCMYLPQFHEISENNNWWGKGYTEWSSVKKAKPLFKKHVQPKIPLNNNYYNLASEDAKTWAWQAKLAKEYGIYGFCIYHYWFKGKQLLEKPMEILLEHPEIDINYSICWANETWTRTWYSLEKEILISQEYGSENDWRDHFNYMLQFFKDKRYIKINNKPMLNIYRSSDIKDLKEMICCFNKLAIENGFDGIYVVASNNNGDLENRTEVIDAYYNFEPGYTLKHRLNVLQSFNYGIKIWLKQLRNKHINIKILERKIDARQIYKVIIDGSETSSKKVFKGIFPMWDNTPRRGYKGLAYINTSPKLFYDALLTLQDQIKNDELDFLYINAWNEWGEGDYLEPDETYKYQYLEAIRAVLSKNYE